ncbi:MAG: cytochrome P450 [Sandaracinaceae bacterium]|nr:cytochrome P450 [Sandaracinaceae bacterium]
MDASGPAFTSLPPGPRWPRVVQLAAWLSRPLELMEHLRARYGMPATLRFPRWPAMVSFDDPEAIKDIFRGSSDDLHAGEANEPLRPIVGSNSLLLLDGERHLRERKLLLPPFHGARMTRYAEVMRDVTLADLARWPLDTPFAVQPRTQAITLDIILRTVFGVEQGSKQETLRAALEALIGDFSRPSLMVEWLHRDLGPRSPWGRYVRTRARTDALIYGEIDARRARPRPGEDIFSMLLEARHEDGAPMGREELRDELITMLVAGHETTATALSWAFHHLIEHPSVERRVHEELDRVMGDGPIDPERSGELVYLDALIKETLRVIPVISAVGRVLHAPTTVGGIELPAGVVAVPSIYLTHRNPKIYPRPERFEPERFLETKPSPYEWLPFGGGVRRCIGMAFALYEMRIVLATVLWRHRVRRAPGASHRPVRRSVTMAPAGGTPIILTRR